MSASQPPAEPDAEDLFTAILARDPEEVRDLLLARPALAHARDEQGQRAIVVARYRYELEILDALLEAAGELDVFEAVVAGNAERVRGLAEADPSLLGEYTPDGFTPLHLAAYFSQPEVVRALLDAGADPAAWSSGEVGLQPLHLAASRPRNVAVLEALAAAGAPLDAGQDGGYTPLHRAAQAGDEDNVRALLRLGADPTLPADDGLTPAETAYAMEFDDLAELLRSSD